MQGIDSEYNLSFPPFCCPCNLLQRVKFLDALSEKISLKSIFLSELSFPIMDKQ